MDTYKFARLTIPNENSYATLSFIREELEAVDNVIIESDDDEFVLRAAIREIESRGYRLSVLDYNRDHNGCESYKIDLEIDYGL